jgi:hypothetical protein
VSLQLQANVFEPIFAPYHLWTILFPSTNQRKKSILVGIQQNSKKKFIQKLKTNNAPKDSKNLD